MMTPDELHNILIGKEIQGVEVSTNVSNDVLGIELRLNDGSVITLTTTSYIYGEQKLKVDVT